MKTFVLFFIVSYIAASADLFIYAESSDLVLVKKQNQIWCAARGETAYSALSWSSVSKNSDVYGTGFNSWNSRMGCNLLTDPPRCQQWYGWYLANSTYYHMPPVLDYRWNDFRLIVTDGSSSLKKENDIPIEFQDNVWEITLSVAAERDAYIYLCDGSDPREDSACYWIILGGWSGRKDKGCAIRRCLFLKNCKNNKVIKSDKVVKEGTWVHVTLKLNKTVDLLLEVCVKNQTILSWNDPKPFDIQYLNVRSEGINAYFRIHKYNFILGNENQDLLSDYFEPESTMQCWSIVYSFLATASEDASLEVKIQYWYSTDTQIVKRLNNSKGEWQHEKFIFKTEEKTPDKMRLIITGTGENSTFAVGGIQQCSLNGDTRTSEMFLVSEDQFSKLMCQALQYPEKDVTLTSLNENFKDCEDCTMNCKQFGILDFENMICFGTSLCKNIGSESVCFCSAGYYDKFCNVACSQRYGVNCKYPCGSCKSNGCEIENGTCRRGCEDGYRPPLCEMRYLVLNKAPEVYGVTFTSIAVYIINITNGEGVPAEYKLQYMLASEIGQESEWITEGTYIFSSSYLHNITSLIPATQYAFRAVVIDTDGGSYDGKNVLYSLYSTNCSDPENIVVEALRNSISINWKITVYACAIQNYTFVIEKDGGDVSVSWAVLPFDVTGLKPFTNYVWKLLYNGLEIEKGFKQTLEDVPSEVRSLTIDNTVSHTSLIIKWEIPENPNGKVRYYRVQYQHCGYLACTDQVCSSPKENHTDSTKIQLENLKPYSKYNIIVTAFTVDYGKENSEIGLTSGFGTLKIRPEFIKNSPIVKEREVELYWTLDCTIISGKIIGYDVILKGTSEWIKEPVRTLTVENKAAKFDNLHPYSKYSASIRVHGENGASDDEYTLVGEFTTKPDEPGKVRNAVSYSFGESWIYLRWEKPYPPTGELEYYEVQYFLGNRRWLKIVKADDYCFLWEEMICAWLDDLKSEVDYRVEIAAKNKDVEQLGGSEIFYVTTRQGAPDPPLNVTATTTSSRKIMLTWKHPDITRGKLTRFEAKATLISTGLNRFVTCNKTEPLLVNNDQIDYILEVDYLCPASDYQIDVYGITVAPGGSSTVYCTTNVSEPHIGSHLSFIPDSVTCTTFQIVIPEPDKYLTDTSAYILIVTSENDVPDYKLSLNFNDKILKRNILKQVGINNDRKSWIAAEIKPGKTKKFEIGDNKTQESDMHFIYFARNRPLTPESLYQVTLVAVNMWRGEYRYSAIKLEKPLKTLQKHEQDSDYTATWVVAGLLILCIPLLVFWFIKRRRVAGKQEKTTLEMKVDDTVIVADTSSVIETENSESKLPPSQRFSQRVVIDDLEQYVKTGLISGELQRQHALFPRGQTRPWDYGKLPENKTKNRYGNLVAYDETRVKLKKFPGDQFSDYINANYINGYNSPRFYIATQGPKRNTVVDFWRMIWQEHVQVIVMLANVIEDTKVKCEKYWPEFGQEVTHGTVTILNASNQIFADYTFRQLNVSCKGKTRKVQHLHFTSWPDHGVPMYPQSLASFLKKLLATSPGSGPITVHCSAGVGRTGTVILSDICLRMAAAEGHVDMLSFLQQIREQRANMVDNLDQYKLVHLLLLECLVTEPSSYPCDASFEKRVQELSNSGIIEKQFNHLFDIRWQDEALRPDVGEIAVSPSHTDTSKNRNLDIVPGPNGRVFISPFPYDDPNSDYINAVYVDGFRVKDQFIVTQFPLESTISDFWRLILEKKVPVIVVLNEIDDEDKSVCQFWPSKTSDSMTPVPHITLTKKQEQNSTYWRRHDIHIASNDAEEESRTVHMLHLKDWRSDEKLPPSTSVILELWQETERLYNGSEPIVVCCLDGAMACGYFVALAFLIEKIKLEQQCDVCQAVRTVRQNRKHFVPTCDQFEYLYKAAVTYLDSFQIYANFN